MEKRAADFIMPDLGWVGGISEGKKIATMAEAYQLPVVPHDCTGPVVLTASCHLSVNAPNAVLQESVRAHYTGWYTEVAQPLPNVENGMIAPPEGPGLGMSLKPEVFHRDDAVIKESAI
jgi:galactonate dehydratase